MPESFPIYRSSLEYVCTNCRKRFEIDQLYYTCPDCGGVFLLEDTGFDTLKQTSGAEWQKLFDRRMASKTNALRGIFRFYELIAPVLDEQDIVYLGEGNTPIIDASEALRKEVGLDFAFKNDGQNPSASFKDRGMACAFSFLRSLANKQGWTNVLAVCASTGDTSAAAAMYAAYLGQPFKSVVLLPKGKVTVQQLAQPLGSGATVLELPGVFDDCMKVVEKLAEEYRVALLNSKNSWRVLGQESYSYEVAQWFDWDLNDKLLFVPIGNAGNISAIMSGLLKMLDLGIIEKLPRLFGVQTAHADPVWQYYQKPKTQRRYQPVQVRPSVAQAAMIGDPVSFPRVKLLVDRYEERLGEFMVIQVDEQSIMDSMLLANRHGHIACTQGGECLAALRQSLGRGWVKAGEKAILDATAHMLKFSGFQEMYFAGNFPPAYGVTPNPALINKPLQLLSEKQKADLGRQEFTAEAARSMAEILDLKKK